MIYFTLVRLVKEGQILLLILISEALCRMVASLILSKVVLIVLFNNFFSFSSNCQLCLVRYLIVLIVVQSLFSFLYVTFVEELSVCN